MFYSYCLVSPKVMVSSAKNRPKKLRARDSVAACMQGYYSRLAQNCSFFLTNLNWSEWNRRQAIYQFQRCNLRSELFEVQNYSLLVLSNDYILIVCSTNNCTSVSVYFQKVKKSVKILSRKLQQPLGSKPCNILNSTVIVKFVILIWKIKNPR